MIEPRRAPCGKGDLKSWHPPSAFHPKAWLRLASSTGLLARGPLLSSAFPEHPHAPVADRVKLAAYSCGLRAKPSPRSLFRPTEVGIDDSTTIAVGKSTASGTLQWH